jgi:UDP-N-acetylmuramate--alanine ligase
VIPDPAVRVPPAADLGAVHLIGVGGAGMSGIARILRARGLPVSGSDARDSDTLAALRALGIRTCVGHSAEQLGDASTVVVSSAVREQNPELAEARRRGLLVLHRSQALAAVMSGRRVVAVAGTHGKTTTTSMVAVALRGVGLDPSFAIGGELTGAGTNAHDGTGDVFVAEADESDGSFLLYSSRVGVVTNVEADHLDHYGTAEAVHEAFTGFCARVVDGGALVVCADDAGALRLAERVAPDLERRGVRLVTYGEGTTADVRVADLEPRRHGSEFDVHGLAGLTERVSLRVPGRHNVLNATAALAACAALGVDPGAAGRALATFDGARRRFEPRGEAAKVRVFDDYAHHPTEVQALLHAAREVAAPGRVVAVFQPHLFSRTRLFATDFGLALGLADEVVVMDVYAAREDPEPGVTGDLVASAVPLPEDRVVFAARAEQAVAEVVRRVQPGDVVLTVGAGDVTEVGPLILAALEPDRRPAAAPGGDAVGPAPGPAW